jgi:hypothetical protein
MNSDYQDHLRSVILEQHQRIQEIKPNILEHLRRCSSWSVNPPADLPLILRAAQEVVAEMMGRIDEMSAEVARLSNELARRCE